MPACNETQEAGISKMMQVVRFKNSPIITPHMDSRMGSNINGPSLIRVPEWLPNPLGKYYLYFAHHRGDYIRLAYADEMAGPWRTYEPGTLQMAQSYFDDHIASPDVHVDNERREIRMYYHGKMLKDPLRFQFTRVATSTDGINFTAREEILGDVPYFRVIPYREGFLATGMPGTFYRSLDGMRRFEKGPSLFTPNMRHTALKLDGDLLTILYTNVGEEPPESILMTTVDLAGDWYDWRPAPPSIVLKPEYDYEGINAEHVPSRRGEVMEPAYQLRDPAFYEEDGRLFLLHTVAGEYGIAIAEVVGGPKS